MTPNNIKQIEQQLKSLEAQGLTRFLRTLPQSGGKITWNDRAYLNFSSNDYLNLANDPRLKAGAIQAIEQYGCGATASRLMTGHLSIHEELEEALAGCVGLESCLVFPSGFQANLGMVTSLVDKTGAVFSDALNHASLVDGCRLSRAQTHIYDHCDMDQLESLLQKVDVPGRKLIVSDSVFSMDGDQAPLVRLAELALKYDCLLAIDEAHAMGVFGQGRGLCHELGVKPDVIMGTLTKALGSGGGFVATSNTIQTLLINTARSFIFSTGLSPACAGAAKSALAVLQDEPDLGETLLNKTAYLCEQLREHEVTIPEIQSQIIPILIGDNTAAMNCMNALIEQGILLTAVRPPTVPKGTARLRLSVTLAHEHADLEQAAKAIAKVVQG